jgi:chemotaxis protein MotC
MRRLGLAAFAAVLMFAAESAQCQEAPGQPVELVRSLRALQDRIAHGDAAAHQSQRKLLAQIAEQLARVADQAWTDPRNARAAVAFVLSGGDARVLRKLLDMGALPGVDDKLVQGALAYSEGRNAEAAELLALINARALDASMAGHVALIQSELIAKKDPQKAMDFLEEARLLSPGTLIEEAALRRHVTALAAAGDFDRFQALATRYLHRFPNSLYAGNFRRQFASEIVARAQAGDAARMSTLESGLAALDAADQREIYLSIAKEGLIKGKLEVTRFAARNAVRLAAEPTADGVRARLYAAAALAVIDASDQGPSALASLEGATLSEDDAELLAAAGSVVAEIRQLPPDGAQPTEAQVNEMAASLKVVAQARQAVERADQMLSEAGK